MASSRPHLPSPAVQGAVVVFTVIVLAAAMRQTATMATMTALRRNQCLMTVTSSNRLQDTPALRHVNSNRPPAAAFTSDAAGVLLIHDSGTASGVCFEGSVGGSGGLRWSAGLGRRRRLHAAGADRERRHHPRRAGRGGPGVRSR